MMYLQSFEQLLREKVKTFVDTFELNAAALEFSKGFVISLGLGPFKEGYSNLMYLGMSSHPERVNQIYNYVYKLTRGYLAKKYRSLNRMIYMNVPISNLIFLHGNDYEAPVRSTNNSMMQNEERPITDWLEADDTISRIKEKLDLIPRAEAKLITKKDKAKDTKESPLRTLKFISDAIKRSLRMSAVGSIRSNRRQRRSRTQKQ